MVLQRVFVRGGCGGVDALEDLDYDGGEARTVEVNFLVVGDLADIAGKGISF